MYSLTKEIVDFWADFYKNHGIYFLLSSLSPYSFDTHSPKALEASVVTNETIPLGAISLFATGSPQYSESVAKVIAKANTVYNDFLRSEEGSGFSGQV